MDDMSFVSKIKRIIKMRHDDVVSAMVSGGVDNMEKYKYLLGQAHAYYKISQDISNLLKKKEPNNEVTTNPTNVVRFDATKD